MEFYDRYAILFAIATFVGFSLVALILFRKKNRIIQARSNTIFFFVIFTGVLIGASFVADRPGNEIPTLYYVSIIFLTPGLIWGVFIAHAWRIHFIYNTNKDKIQIVKKLSYLMVTEKESFNQLPKNLKNITKKHIDETSSTHVTDDSLAFEKTIPEIEKRILKRRAIFSEKFFFLVLTSILVLILILAIIIFYTRKINRTTRKYSSDKVFLAMLVLMVCILLGNLIYLLVKIRKIKDPYKIKKEIYGVVVNQFVIIVVFVINQLSGVYIRNRVLALITCFNQYLIVFGYPLYLSFRYEKKSKETIEQKEAIYPRFLEIINNKSKLPYFVKFCESDYSIENIMFYQASKTYKNSNSKKKRKKLIQKIYKQFIIPTAPLQINISSKVSNEVSNEINNGSVDVNLLQPPCSEILELMYTNTYPVFLESDFYSNMLIETNNAGLEILNERDDDIELDTKEKSSEQSTEHSSITSTSSSDEENSNNQRSTRGNDGKTDEDIVENGNTNEDEDLDGDYNEN
ncbi:double hit [Anaeramoeba flamelloides]|uniref:Double hit n=1 Tax=Anaeramoeba flamelloides TaxID=1746091 RepID=A0ABQ8XC53_9EUKA|nr:double hit [Anaeramoeba flamelloides]